MTLCIFTGPTIAADEARTRCHATYLPPVRQGDVYRVAVTRRPRAMGIIDGYFQQVPSVWHKEILWAMAKGIHMFGSASMGALRAAELTDFGMHGIGKIFAAYRNGFLEPFSDEAFEDDDEVAVIHGPADTGYIPLSEALVNIRCTLTHAHKQGVITGETRNTLVHIGKSIFYPRRTYDSLFEIAAQQGIAAKELNSLQSWLEKGQINQKREDAVEMLGVMQNWLETNPPQKQVDYHFAHTEMWQSVMTSPLNQESYKTDTAVLTELRLEEQSFRRVRHAALLRGLVLRRTNQQDVSITRREVKQFTNDFRRRANMLDRTGVDHWLANNNLDLTSFDRLMIDETRLKKLESLHNPQLDQDMVDQLHLSGDYPRLLARAQRKAQILKSNTHRRQEYRTAPPYPLLAWYFEDRLGQSIPDDLDTYATDLGFTNSETFYQALAEEYLLVSNSAAEGE